MSEKSPLLRSRTDDLSWYVLHPNVLRIVAVLLLAGLAYAAYAVGKAQATQVTVTVTDVTLSKPALTEPAPGSEVSALTLTCTDDADARLRLTGQGQVSVTVSGDAQIEMLAESEAVVRVPAGGGTFDIAYFGEDADLSWSTSEGRCVESFSSRADERGQQ